MAGMSAENIRETAWLSDAVVHGLSAGPASRQFNADLLQVTGLATVMHNSFEAFIDYCGRQNRAVQDSTLVIFLQNGDSGLNLLARLSRRQKTVCPVILIRGGYVTIREVVAAFELGAFKVLERPFWDQTLSDTVVKALWSGRKRSKLYSLLDEDERRLSCLSSAERQVAERLALGGSGKEIASDLGISVSLMQRRQQQVLEKLEISDNCQLVAFIATYMARKASVAA